MAAEVEASKAEPIKNEYQILSPVPSGLSIEPIEHPARLYSLNGKRIALVGGSFSAFVTHQFISDMLEDKYGCITYYMTDEIGKSGTFNPNSISGKSKEFQQKLKEYSIDAVISGNCGCGICTVNETGNGLAAEYAGVPAVVVGAEAFIPQIESTGYSRGVPVVRTAAYPGAFANDTTGEQLGISYEDGMINEEANKLLGRFVSLAMLNLAGYKIKENRMSTFGYMLSFAFAEDEQACLDIGWNPYHIEKGYDLNTSVVTCCSTLTWGNPIDIGTTNADEAIQLLAWDVTEKQQSNSRQSLPVYKHAG